MTRPDKPVNDILIDAYLADLIAKAEGKTTGHLERAVEITRQIHSSSTRRGGASATATPSK